MCVCVCVWEGRGGIGRGKNVMHVVRVHEWQHERSVAVADQRRNWSAYL